MANLVVRFRERMLKLAVDKVTWQRVGHVTEPGRYMFRFGWLTIAPDDLEIWTHFPEASFTLVQTASPPLAADPDEPVAETGEFHLGVFELPRSPDLAPKPSEPV